MTNLWNISLWFTNKYVLIHFYFFVFQHLLRRVLINQHKLQKYLQQQTRLCSHERAQAQPNVDDFESIRSVNAATPRFLPDPKPIEHGPDNGRLFSVSFKPILNHGLQQFWPGIDNGIIVFIFYLILRTESANIDNFYFNAHACSI